MKRFARLASIGMVGGSLACLIAFAYLVGAYGFALHYLGLLGICICFLFGLRLCDSHRVNVLLTFLSSAFVAKDRVSV